MTKLIGYVEMKKRKGKVCFISEKMDADSGFGERSEQIFLYDDLSDKILPASIGKDIQISYGCGYNGKAYVTDVIIK